MKRFLIGGLMAVDVATERRICRPGLWIRLLQVPREARGAVLGEVMGRDVVVGEVLGELGGRTHVELGVRPESGQPHVRQVPVVARDDDVPRLHVHPHRVELLRRDEVLVQPPHLGVPHPLRHPALHRKPGVEAHVASDVERVVAEVDRAALA